MCCGIEVALQPGADSQGLHDIPPSVRLQEEIHHELWDELDERMQALKIREVILKAITHEVDEWLRVNGGRVVEPHPENVAKLTGVAP